MICVRRGNKKEKKKQNNGKRKHGSSVEKNETEPERSVRRDRREISRISLLAISVSDERSFSDSFSLLSFFINSFFFFLFFFFLKIHAIEKYEFRRRFATDPAFAASSLKASDSSLT